MEGEASDDNSVWVLEFDTENSGEPTGAPQIPPLRFAPVGMTEGTVRAYLGIVDRVERTAAPSTTLRSG